MVKFYAMVSRRVGHNFYQRDVLQVAPELLGMALVRQIEGGRTERFIISEVEAYRGTDDMACHASKGRTARTEAMFLPGGHLYVYLIYGMHWMMNIVTGMEGNPQAVLVRGVMDCNGPGRVTRKLSIDKVFNGEDLCSSVRVWVEETNLMPGVEYGPRIGVSYAGPYWANVPWRMYCPELGVPR